MLMTDDPGACMSPPPSHTHHERRPVDTSESRRRIGPFETELRCPHSTSLPAPSAAPIPLPSPRPHGVFWRTATDSVVNAARKRLEELGSSPAFHVIRGSPPFFVEFLNPSVCKGGRRAAAAAAAIAATLTLLVELGCQGNGLEELCRRLDVPLGQVVAFGDGDNDLEFLQVPGRVWFHAGCAPSWHALPCLVRACMRAGVFECFSFGGYDGSRWCYTRQVSGLGIAMLNAREVVKAAADKVAPGSTRGGSCGDC